MRAYWMTSDRLGFSTWAEGDASLAAGLWGDPRVTLYLCATGLFSPEEIIARLRQEINMQKTAGVQYWPLFQRQTGAFVGCCGLRPFAGEEAPYELGLHLRSGCWGRGYGSEAARAVIAHAQRALGAQRLFAGHHPENRASAALLSRLGFVYHRDMYYPPTGLLHPSYLLCLPAATALPQSP